MPIFNKCKVCGGYFGPGEDDHQCSKYRVHFARCDSCSALDVVVEVSICDYERWCRECLASIPTDVACALRALDSPPPEVKAKLDRAIKELEG